MSAQETYFLDTNVLVRVSECLRVKREGGDTSKLKPLKPYYTFLLQLLNNGHRVVISRISILEMYFLYHRWFYYDKKSAERAPFDEIFGREANYELEDEEREEIVNIMESFIQESKNMGIAFSNVDKRDVIELAEILYSGSKPSVEPYDLSIYANSILDCSKYLVTDDGSLCKAIDYLRQKYKEEVTREIIDRFGEEKYPYWAQRHNLPNAKRPR
jgi:hypothetical protein